MPNKKTTPEPGSTLFKTWLLIEHDGVSNGVRVYREQAAMRQKSLPILKNLLAEHYVGEAVILASGGFSKAAEIIKNSLPDAKRIRSGDLAELLATEYLNAETSYRVPVRKLQWKSDRDTPLHGNDVIGVDSTGARPVVLKCECKSRAQFKPSDAQEAVTGLDGNGGRPNPSTLAFIAKRLYEQKRDVEAKVFQDMLTSRAIRMRDVKQLVFVLSGNEPSKQLAGVVVATKYPRRSATAIAVANHVGFVASVFE